jgi:hypothetical protein
MIHLAALAGDAPLYIVHLSSAEGLHEVHKARSEGRPNLGVETCTQYLILNDSLYDDPVEGLKAIMSPPLRKDSDREELWAALSEGDIIDNITGMVAGSGFSSSAPTSLNPMAIKGEKMSSQNGSYTSFEGTKNVTIENVDNGMRLAWIVSTDNTSSNTNGNYWLYLDDIKVQIANQ